MKSAYEAALDRLQEHGIDPPRKGSLPAEIQERIAEIRSRAEAGLAQLEILLQDRLRAARDPDEREKARQEYAAERQRVADRRDRDIDRLRSNS